MEITQLILTILTGVLAFATVVLAWSTNKYRKATERLAKAQEQASDVNEAIMQLMKHNLMYEWSRLTKPEDPSVERDVERVRNYIDGFVRSHLLEKVKANNLPNSLLK